MTKKVIPFLGKVDPRKVECIGILTIDDRDFWISDQKDMQKVMAFIKREGIKLNPA